MEVILRLFSELRLVLIAIAGICAAAFVFTGLSSLREMRRAVFRLERSAITGRVISSWLKAGLCVIAGAVIWVVSATPARPSASANNNPLSVTSTPTTVAVGVPTSVPTADLSQAQAMMTSAPPTDILPVDPLAAVITPAQAPAPAVVTPTVPAASSEAVPTPTAAPVAQPAVQPAQTQAASLPTLPPIPTVSVPTPAPLPGAAPTNTSAPAPEQSFVANCPSRDALITDPVPGETITGGYAIRGTAGFNQGKYKIEILRPNIQGWAFLWEGFNQVKSSTLMPNFNAKLFPPGVYTLRLMLVDVAGQETDITCTVPFRIG